MEKYSNIVFKNGAFFFDRSEYIFIQGEGQKYIPWGPYDPNVNTEERIPVNYF